MNYNKIAKDLHKTYALTTGPRALTHIQALAVWREFGENLPNDWADNIPKNYLVKYCLKGTGNQEGTFIIAPELRKQVQFIHANLKNNLSQLGTFDVIFLRNVLIYFDIKTKQQVVSQLLKQLKPNGYFIVGHSESLNGVVDNLKAVIPSVYQKR